MPRRLRLLFDEDLLEEDGRFQCDGHAFEEKVQRGHPEVAQPAFHATDFLESLEKAKAATQESELYYLYFLLLFI